MDSSAASSTFNLECPISLKWIIAEEKLAELKDSTTNGSLETKWFKVSNLPGVKYSLTIYPNGREEENRGEVWILLFLLVGYETITKADVKFLVESPGFSHNLSHEYDYSYGEGIKICSTSEFFDPDKKFIVDGNFTLKCEGILGVEPEGLFDDENGIKFDDEHIGHKLWKNDDKKDFIIKVGENSVNAHKYVLAAQSPVFEAMFESGMKETTENQMIINDFPFKVVEAGIQLCYNYGTVDTLKLKEKMGLLQFFDKYGMNSHKASCEASLIKDVSAFSVCQLANCSIISNAIKLQQKCSEFLTQCIKAGTPVADIALLDNDFTHKVLSNACSIVHQT